MLLLLVLAETVVQLAPVAPKVQARATVRIERGAAASASEWKSTALQLRRDVIRKRADGTFERIRMVDYP